MTPLFLIGENKHDPMQLSEKIKETIRDVLDYPTPGIVFKDITPVLADPYLCKEIVDQMAQRIRIAKD